jgi:hypothetical protein
MQNLKLALGILIFYGILSIVTALIGNYINKKNGFTWGYILGNVISVILWLSVGEKAAKK